MLALVDLPQISARPLVPKSARPTFQRNAIALVRIICHQAPMKTVCPNFGAAGQPCLVEELAPSQLHQLQKALVLASPDQVSVTKRYETGRPVRADFILTWSGGAALQR